MLTHDVIIVSRDYVVKIVLIPTPKLPFLHNIAHIAHFFNHTECLRRTV